MSVINDISFSLISAVHDGNLERTRELVKRYGLSYCAEWSKGYVLLCDAAERNHTSIAELLLLNGCKVNKRSRLSIKHLNTPLHFAASNGNRDIVRLVLDKGANIDAINIEGSTPLHIAVHKNNRDIAELLIKHGAEVNAADLYNKTPLHYAIRKSSFQIVELLLNYGASANMRSNGNRENGYTPLHMAVESGSLEINLLLLCRGAKVDVKGRDNTTPLHIAAQKGYRDITEDLLNHGACVHSLTEEGYTPLHFASQQENCDIVKLLLSKGADFNAATKSGLTPLHIATKEDNLGVVKLLFQNGAKVDVEDKDGQTVLYLAVKRCHVTIVDEVLKYCPGSNNQSNRNSLKYALLYKGNLYNKICVKLINYGFTVSPEEINNSKLLHSVVEKGYLTILEDLLRNGADVNTSLDSEFSMPARFSLLNINESKGTLLHSAVINKQEEITKLLISYRADVNAVDGNGNTPLHKAVKNSKIEVVDLFLKHGADANAVNKYKKTPLHNAVKNESMQIAELLLNYGASANVIYTTKWGNEFTPLHIAVESRLMKITSLLLRRGAKVDIKVADGTTPLHIAAQKGYIDVTKKLLNHGASVQSVTEEGYTPLHFASQVCNYTILKLLLSMDADINLATKNGLTPLHIATEEGNIHVVRLLLQSGAKVDLEDKDGKTVLYLAVEEGHETIVDEVLKYRPDINNQSNRNSLKTALLGYGEQYKNICLELIKYGFTVGTEEVNNSQLLHNVVEKGNLKILEYLLKNGADVNILLDSVFRKDRGFTLLHRAVEKNQGEIVKLLISCAADVNAKDSTEETPLFYAIRNLDFKMTKLLLTNGASVKSNTELLNIAAERWCVEIVEALLHHGADVSARDEYGNTPLHYIVKNDSSAQFHLTPTANDIAIIKRGEVAKMLLRRGADVNAQTNYGVTPLQLAILNGYTDVVKVFLEYNANVNVVGKNNQTLLHLSAEKGFAEICKMLSDKGVNVDSKSKDGSTALITAIKKGHREVVKVLLERSTEINYKVENDFTPLHLAAKNGHSKIVEDILTCGADVNYRDKDGRTALHIASLERHIGAAETLLRFGADINITCKQNRTPLTLVINKFQSIGNLYYNCDRIVGYFNKHMHKMKTANMYVSEANENKTLIEDEELFVLECKREMLVLRSQKIADSNITFYDLLTKNTSSLALSLRNNNIVQVLKSDNYKKEFPNYAILIESNYRKAMEIRGLLDQLDNNCHLFNKCPELPNICTEKILSYLSNTDLRLLLEAYKPL